MKSSLRMSRWASLLVLPLVAAVALVVGCGTAPASVGVVALMAGPASPTVGEKVEPTSTPLAAPTPQGHTSDGLRGATTTAVTSRGDADEARLTGTPRAPSASITSTPTPSGRERRDGDGHRDGEDDRPEPTPVIPPVRLWDSVDVDAATVQAVTDIGERVRSTGGTVQMARAGERITLPLEVPAGALLGDVTDASTGMTVRTGTILDPRTGKPERDRTVLRIPVRDGTGKSEAVLRAVLASRPAGTGRSAEAIVERLEMELPRRAVGLTGNPNVSRVAVDVTAELRSMPDDATVQVSVAPAPASAAGERMAQVAAENGLRIEHTAFAVEVVKSATLNAAVGAAMLALEVDRAWVQDVGLENVRVFRVADDGTPQVLAPVADDPKADPVVFRVLSPDGLSVFALTAVQRVANAPATVMPDGTATPRSVPSITPEASPSPTPTVTAEAVLSPTPTVTPSAPAGGGSGGGVSGGMIAAGVATVLVVGAVGGGYFAMRARRSQAGSESGA